MSKACNSLKLAGYITDELSNGYFIVHKEGGLYSLYDTEGNKVIYGMREIIVLSDMYYRCISAIEEENNNVLYNKHGEIIAKVSKYFDIDICDNMISVKFTDANGKDSYNVYEVNGNAEFKGIQGDIISVIEDAGTYKLVYTDYKIETRESFIECINSLDSDEYDYDDVDQTISEFEAEEDEFRYCHEQINIIDTNGNETHLCIKCDKVQYANSHYIVYRTHKIDDNRCKIDLGVVIDYTGKVIFEHVYNDAFYSYDYNNIFIDVIAKEPSKYIIELVDKDLNVYNENGKLIKTLHNMYREKYESFIAKVDFTSEPDIICIHKSDTSWYLYNIVNDKKSETYSYIDCEKLIGSHYLSYTQGKVIHTIDKVSLKSKVLPQKEEV